MIAIDTETVVDAGRTVKTIPFVPILVSMCDRVAPGEAYYLPLQPSRLARRAQGELLIDAAVIAHPTDAPEDRGFESAEETSPRTARTRERAARGISSNETDRPESAAIESDEMKPLRDLLEDPSVKKPHRIPSTMFLSCDAPECASRGSTSIRCSRAMFSIRAGGRTVSMFWPSSFSITR